MLTEVYIVQSTILRRCHWGSKQHYNGDVMEIPDVYTSLCLHYSLMHAHAQ